MRKWQAMRAAVVLSAMTAAWPGTSQAITILSADRLVEAFATSYCPGCGPNGEDEYYTNGESIPSSATGLFDEYASSAGSHASQNSTVSSSQISGVGTIGLGFTSDNQAESHLLVDFQVPTLGSYRLNGDLATDDYISDGFIELSSLVDGVLLHRDASIGGSEFFDQTFALVPGRTYTLEAKLAGIVYGEFPFAAHWSFAFASVPEPGTAGLLGAALLTWIGARRRSRAVG